MRAVQLLISNPNPLAASIADGMGERPGVAHVPALSTTQPLVIPAFFKDWINVAAAIGDLKRLPVQTKRTDGIIVSLVGGIKE